MLQILKSGRTAATIVAVLASAAALGGCDSVKDTLLSAPDPDIIDPSSVQSAAGANAVRVGALSRLRSMTGGAESTWLFGGLLADEWSTSSTFVQNDEADERSVSTSNSSVNTQLRQIYRVRTAANQAIGLLNRYRPTPASDIGEMYFIRGIAELQLASDFCNGIPLSDATTDPVILGSPRPISDIFTVAVASFDSAIALSGGTDAASVAISRAAKIGKGRALVGLNKVDQAAVAVAGIPTTYTYDVTYSLTGGTNTIWAQGASARRYTVGDSLEGNSRSILVKNAIPFFSAKDPRLPVAYTTSNGGKDTTKSQDGITYSRTTTLYGQLTSTAVVNGIDARMIEAEAALAAGNPAGMMTILNAVRATPITIGAVTTPAMAALTDPGTADSRINLIFREKAFWTFSRGQRLGDMRRLVRQYNRPADEVFPVGSHYRGATYGGDVNLPVTTDESNGNENFPGCTDRKA
jgi:hypothetical protein